MKRWQKRLLTVFAVVISIVIGGMCVYNFYAKEKIENMLEKAQKVLNDEKLQKEVDTFIVEMIESGDLEDADIEGYLGYKEAMVQEKDTETLPTAAPASTLKPAKAKPVATQRPKTLIERVREAMTPEEFAFAMSMYGKVDINYCLANYHSNKKAVKKHIKSVLTSAEISRSLEIYGKYSYLLK